MTDLVERVITASLVEEGNRSDFVDQMDEMLGSAGATFIFRCALFLWMTKLTSGQYKCGYWECLKLSNGGFYLRLKSDATFSLERDDMGGQYQASAETVSIWANLFAFDSVKKVKTMPEQSKKNALKFSHCLREYHTRQNLCLITPMIK